MARLYNVETVFREDVDKLFSQSKKPDKAIICIESELKAKFERVLEIGHDWKVVSEMLSDEFVSYWAYVRCNSDDGALKCEISIIDHLDKCLEFSIEYNELTR